MARLNVRLTVMGAEKYPAKQHAQRVATELGVSEGLIYLLGQQEALEEDSDRTLPWRQRRYFYYCTGVDVPDCSAVYDIKSDELVLYIPESDPKQVAWVGRPPNREEALQMFDVDEVRYSGSLLGDLRRRRDAAPSIAFYILHDDHSPDVDGLDHVNSKDLQPAIDRCRVIKDTHEIQCIRKANQASATAHRAVLRSIRRLDNEMQIQAVFEYALTANGVKPGYPTIAGSGPNAATLHYTANNEPLEGRQLVCMDAAAEFQNYGADVTRTFPISGYFSTEAQEIYSLVELMQESSIQSLKPGKRMWDLHVRCHKLLIEGFLRLGIFHNGSLDEIYKAGTSKAFLPHGLGHHLGLETHDVLNIPILHYRDDEAKRSDAMQHDAALGSSSGRDPKTQKHEPVNFSGVISYVNKVKTRFHDQPNIYTQFLEILHTYQEESRPIQEVHAEITQLFNAAPDLLEGFSHFVPDSAVAAADASAGAPRHANQPPMRAGMVVTIEPGIYFNRYELNRAYLHAPEHSKYINTEVLDRYWSVGGVRIEDDILITEDGYENLTTAPKGSEALELIRSGRDRRDEFVLV